MKVFQEPILTFGDITSITGHSLFAENRIFISRGRDAIDVLVNSGILNPNISVLIPSYTCDVITDPLLEKGITLKYYSISNQFTVNLNEIVGLIDRRTKILLVIHYFGIIQNIEDIRNFCHDNQLLLIEDCAHSFLSKYKGEPGGCWGDISFFSFRKTVPVPDGGMIQVNNTAYSLRKAELQKSGLTRSLKWLLKNSILNFELRTGMDLLKILDRNRNHNMTEQATSKDNFTMMSELSHFLLKRFDLEKIMKTRSRNYNYLARGLGDIDKFYIPHSYVDEDTCPMVLPVILRHGDNRSFCMKLNEKGIGVYPWPRLSSKMCKEKSEQVLSAIELSQKVVLFPIHQNLRGKHLNFIIDSTRKIISNA